MLAHKPQRCGLRGASRSKPFSGIRRSSEVFHSNLPRRSQVNELRGPYPLVEASGGKYSSDVAEELQGETRQQQLKQLQPDGPEQLDGHSSWQFMASRILAGAAGFAATICVAAAVTLAGLLGPSVGADSSSSSMVMGFGAPLRLQQLMAPVQAAQAISTEQLLFLEAWRAVDRAYVDKGFNGQSWFRVRENYLKKESFESRTQTYDAIRKLVASLDDPFTRFLEPSRLADLRRGTQKSSVTGVGLEVSFTEGSGLAGSLLRVVTPAEGGPADRAGVRPGDVILAVDGKPTTGISLYEASDLLQGPPGTPVVLLVQSYGPDGKSLPPRDFNLIRELVVIRPVSYSLCGGVDPATGLKKGSDGAGPLRVGYIRLSTFNSNTYQGVVAALKEAKAAGVDGLILDLRNNGGGLFPAGVEVAKLLMPRGDIVLISDSAGVRDIYSTDGSETMDTATPLSVWVNKGTASASEVLAGALKDSGRGVVVGENSFGKGLIQTVVDLSDGSGLAITVAKYQTPSGLDINRIGITPDIPLAPERLASGGAAVCDLLATPTAPRVFG